MDEGHSNMVRAQETWDAIGRGELAGLDDFRSDLVVENGPGAGPWRRVEGVDGFVEMVLQFIPYFGETWHQDGTCVWADDRSTISVVHETGTAPDGDAFDNMAIWISRLDPEGKTERIWTIDLDQEHCEGFWDRHIGELPGG